MTAQRIGAALVIAAATCCGCTADTASVEITDSSNNPPNTPSLSVGATSATGVTLTGSAFSDADAGNTHASTQWQVDLASGNYSSPVFDSGEVTTGLLTRAVSGLTASTAYQARVRYRDNTGVWSVWSASQNFTTTSAGNNNPPATPTLTVSGITAVAATLNGSPFSDPNPGDTHLSSEWQVDEQGGNWATLVANSGISTTNLTSFVATGLTAGTNYQARVRYRDNTNTASASSATVNFTTASAGTNSPPNAPTLSVSGVTANSATLTGSAFSDPDAGNTHGASEWQVDQQGGDWATLVASSGVTTTSLTSFVGTGLTSSTSYQARVRYRDNNNAWSGWSGTQSFTAQPPAPPAPVASVSVTPTTATITVGGATQLTATARDAGGNVISGTAFTWTSSTPGVATVSGNGTTTGIAAGSATVTASASGHSGSANITVQAATGGPAQVRFFSDWRTAANGSSIASLRDGNKWIIAFGSTNNAEIVDAPAGFPTLKAYHAYTPNGANDGAIQLCLVNAGQESSSPIPALPIGDTRTWRWYASMVMPGTMGDPWNHPWQDGGAVSQANWSIDTHMRTRGGQNFDTNLYWGMLSSSQASAPWSTIHLGSGNWAAGSGTYSLLQKRHAYRFEVQIYRISSSTHRLHLWVYDGDGTLLYDDDDFRNSSGTATLASNPVLPTPNPNSLRNPVFGIEGVGHNAPDWSPPMDMMYMAGIAIVDGLPERQPIGAYGSVAGEVRR
jgi:hypothetical protein